MIAYKKQNLISKTPLENVKLGGYAATLMNAFLYGRVFSDHARNVVFAECEEAFARATDGDRRMGLWQGEFWGKWVLSAARVCRYSGNEELKRFLHDAALRLISMQRENGYLGTYKVSTNFMPPEGIVNGWNWNIWCRKYTLWGLLECYELTGDENILSACVRLADNLICEIKESGKRLGETGTFKGVASCSILKPMLILYRITEDGKYLDFCLNFVNDWEDPEIIPGLIANSITGRPLGEWYDFDIKWAKAYEMMSCFDGLLELYRVTGTEKYLTATECFYEILLKYELNPLYSVAFNDEFRSASSNVNAITEPCDVIHFMRLCHELFALTGDSKYMDSFELAFYNPFLASSFKDGMWGTRGTRSLGRHLVVREQAKMNYNHCCVNNMPRGYMNMVETQVMSSEESLYVNLYTPADIRAVVGGNEVKVSISGDYLADSKANIALDFGSNVPCTVKLRIPSWSENSKVKADGNEYAAECGYFSLVPQNSKCEIEVEFDNSVKITAIPATLESVEDTWKCDRWVSTNAYSDCTADMFLREGRCVLRKGAVLLCRSKLIGNTKEEMFGEDTRIDDTYRCTLVPQKASAGINVQFYATLENGQTSFTTPVCDFASGSNMEFDSMYAFNIYF